ncbi:MAG: Gfo/Idh/MocA family oxidoreductase, partial [Balneolaceae bacterium]
HLFCNVKGLFSICETQIDERIDEEGNRYKATADDAVYTTFELENGALAHFNTSWTTRVRRDDLLTIQIDGKKGSAVAGLRDVWIQPYEATPKPVWNPDVENSHNYLDDWMKVPNQQDFENAFRIQWELFLKYVVADTPYKWNFLEAAKGTQLADLGYKSSEQRTWVEVPELK